MLATLALVAVVAFAQDPEPACVGGRHRVLPFPLQTWLAHPTRRAHCFTPTADDRNRMRALRGYRCVLLDNLWLPGGAVVDLLLTRIDDVAPGNISINGSPVGDPNNPLPSAMTLWSGSIENLADSQVCLAFADVGVWGWIRTDRNLFQVASFPQGGSWNAFSTVLVDDVDKNRIAGWQCGDVIDEPLELPLDVPGCIYGLAPPRWREQCPESPIAQLRLCTMAVETDYQFYQRFRDTAAAEVYARFIIDAVAQQLRLDARAVIRIDYLGLHTTVNDPWHEQDISNGQTNSPCCIDVIYEFQHEWGTDDWAQYGARFHLGPGNGNAPVVADIYHMMSGAEMGCGVGGGKVGSGGEAVSLSSGMGAVNFDNQNIVDGNGNVLFEARLSPYFQIYGAGHEIGHNFGAPHTHELRYDVNGTPNDPSDDVPIDDCGVDPSGGAPSCAGIGFARSTLMSYCLGCRPEFLRNIRVDYHEQIARCMRVQVANLPLFEDAHFVTDLGFGSAPAGQSPPTLAFTGYSPGLDRLKLSSTGLPPHSGHALVISTTGGIYTTLLGFMLVPNPEIVWAVPSAATPIDLPIPDGIPNGVVVHFQQVLVSVPDVYASNAIALEIVR